MVSMIAYEVALLVVIAAGWLAGRWLLKRNQGRGIGAPDAAGDTAAAEPEGLGDTIGFVGGAFGILLGLLLVFTVGHFVDARQVTKDEAATASALFSGVTPFSAEVRDPLRHDLVCYMQSVATDDWSATSAGDLTGSENTAAYAARLQEKISALPADEAIGESSQYLVAEEFLDLTKFRQLRLLHSVPEVPAVIWAVLYASAFLFVGLTVLRLAGRRRMTRLAIGATTALLLISVGALIQLDAPYRGVGTSLQPIALDAAITRLRAATPEPASVWEPCDRLAAEAAG